MRCNGDAETSVVMYHPAPYAQPQTMSQGCLGCVSGVNGAQWQSADRGVCLKGRDHPSMILPPYSWCWAASALSLLLQLGT